MEVDKASEFLFSGCGGLTSLFIVQAWHYFFLDSKVTMHIKKVSANWTI